jgi:hypothetical protein
MSLMVVLIYDYYYSYKPIVSAQGRNLFVLVVR